MKTNILLLQGFLLFFFLFSSNLKSQNHLSGTGVNKKSTNLDSLSYLSDSKSSNNEFNNYNRGTNAGVISKSFAPHTPSETNLIKKLTHIEYEVKEDGPVKIFLIDSENKPIGVILNKFQYKGTYTALFNGSVLQGGTFYYKIKFGDIEEPKKLLTIQNNK